MEYKKEFIDDLSIVLAKHFGNFGVTKLEYVKPGHQYHEEVIIHYHNGYTEHVNVTWDSPLGMLRDIVKQGLQL